ncbi:MAG: ABC transporter substrate-binding protein, partial [Rhodoferax sp.]|nr:ABC transporter substrate-binding protein [Rhodoferax sp.]
MVNRRSLLTSTVATATLCALPFAAQAQAKKDALVLAMALEPAPGLDPTGGAASAIAEITLYNVFETLTKIN